MAHIMRSASPSNRELASFDVEQVLADVATWEDHNAVFELTNFDDTPAFTNGNDGYGEIIDFATRISRDMD